MLNIVLFAFLIFTSGIFHFNQKKMEAKAELKIMIEGGETDAVARSLPAHGLSLVSVEYDGFPPNG